MFHKGYRITLLLVLALLPLVLTLSGLSVPAEASSLQAPQDEPPTIVTLDNGAICI